MASPQPIDPHLMVLAPEHVMAALGIADRDEALRIIRALPHRGNRPPKVSRKVFEAWLAGCPAEALREAATSPSFIVQHFGGGS